MALFQVDIEKRLSSEFWSNRYICYAPNVAEATSLAEDIVAAERSLHTSLVSFTRFRVSSTAVGDGVYTIQPINQNGTRSNAQGLLPLFNTIRYDIAAAVGRPSRKFYRGVLGEEDIAGDALVAQAIFTTFIINLEPLLATDTILGICDPQGTLLTQITLHPFVQMRQLRRSRRKRSNGGGIFQ